MRDIETSNVFQNAPLVVGAKSTFFKEFPLSKGWYKVNINININLVAGTASGPVSEGELLFIKNLYLVTDKNEILANLPGRALYRIAQLKSLQRVEPIRDPIAAVDGTYKVSIPLYFVEHESNRPQDSIFDSGRYRTVKLEVALGTVADLFTTPGTATVTSDFDLEIEHSPGILPRKAQPILYQTFFSNGPQDVTQQRFIDLDKSRDLAIKRLYIFTASGAVGGVPFTGTPADDILLDLDIQDQDKFYQRQRLFRQARQDTFEVRGSGLFANFPPGWIVFDFVKDRSIFSSLYTGNKSILKVEWRNVAGVVANDQVSIAVEGVRALSK